MLLYNIVKKILLTFLFFIFFAVPVSADYTTAKTDYTYQYNLYREGYDAYLVAKSTFSTYKTLTSQADALAKERLVLQARDQVITSYFNLLQEKLSTQPTIDPKYKQTFSGIRVNENLWLSAHQKKISAAANFDDLNTAAADFEDHFPQFDRETKQAFGTIILNNEADLKLTADEQVSALKIKLTEMRSAGDDTTFSDRGLIDVQNKLDLSLQKYQDAKTIFFPKSDNQDPINLLSGQQRLTAANQYLREAVNFLWEIVWKITLT